MRILYFGNGWLGWQVLKWLRSRGESIEGLVIHPENRQQYGSQILEAAGLQMDHIFDGSRLNDPDAIERIKTLRPELGILVQFGYILRPEFISLFPKGCINLHPSYLPFNRGAHPNVWSITDGTPAGATLHRVDAGIDTGAVLAQKKIEIEPVDTAQTLYHKLERCALELFMETFPAFKKNELLTMPQPAGEGTAHRVRDLKTIDEIDLDKTYQARELINILRARTFAPYPGAFFKDRGRKVHMRLELEYGEETCGEINSD